MLDLNYIHNNPDKIRWAIQVKKTKVDLDEFLTLDKKRRELQKEIEFLRSKRNKFSGAHNIEEGKKIKNELRELEEQIKSVQEHFDKLYKMLPNVPSEDTPVGDDEGENKVIKQCGRIPTFDFTPKDHTELGSELELIDSEKAGEIVGSRFAYLKGDLVLMQQAIIHLTFQTLSNKAMLEGIAKDAGLDINPKPFIPVLPPVFIRPEIMDRMGRLEPREERYHIDVDDLYLIGSAEHTLGPIHMNEIIEEQDLPIRYVGFSTSFRREAGSYGKDVKGILRQHQFDKIEMETFVVPEDGLKEQYFIVAIQEHLISALKLPYQVVQICTGDMGAPDIRQVDIETWIPSQNKYRETHTSDYMGNYQSMRLQTRVKRKNGENEYVHMNDATAFALGRILLAIMENYQEADGSIRVPEVLIPLVGKEVIQ